MKTYGGSGCIDPGIVDLGTSWSGQGHFPAASPPGEEPPDPVDRRLGKSQSRSARRGELRNLGAARSQSLYRLSYHGSILAKVRCKFSKLCLEHRSKRTINSCWCRSWHLQWQVARLCWICDSHSGVHHEFYLHGYNVVWPVETQPSFRRNILPRASGSKSKPLKKNSMKQAARRWRRYVSPKRRFTFIDLYGILSQKI
jgi:hypothetical protein